MNSRAPAVVEEDMGIIARDLPLKKLLVPFLHLELDFSAVHCAFSNTNTNNPAVELMALSVEFRSPDPLRSFWKLTALS